MKPVPDTHSEPELFLGKRIQIKEMSFDKTKRWGDAEIVFETGSDKDCIVDLSNIALIAL